MIKPFSHTKFKNWFPNLAKLHSTDVTLTKTFWFCQPPSPWGNYDTNGNENVTKQAFKLTKQWLCTCLLILNFVGALFRTAKWNLLGLKNVPLIGGSICGGNLVIISCLFLYACNLCLPWLIFQKSFACFAFDFLNLFRGHQRTITPTFLPCFLTVYISAIRSLIASHVVEIPKSTSVIVTRHYSAVSA